MAKGEDSHVSEPDLVATGQQHVPQCVPPRVLKVQGIQGAMTNVVSETMA